MRNIKNIISTVSVIAATFSLSNAVAQEPNTPQTVERTKMESLWFSNTDNAAGAQLDNIDYFSQLSVYYDREKGSLKRAQNGADNNTFGFSTDGGGKVASLKGTFLWGYFDYKRTKVEDAEYNASLIDPLRGTPFYIADQNKSDWINQDYSLGLKAASPILWDHFVVGMALNYENGQGAKQRDPRPKVFLSKFDITPSIVYTVCHNTFGVDFTYASRREDGVASNSISFISQPIWEVVAPGFFNVAEIGGSGLSGLRAYNANTLGGGLQYGFAGKKFSLLLSGKYSHSVEDVNNNYTKPKIIGTTKDNIWNGKVNAVWKMNKNNSLFVNAEYYDRSIDGIEYIQIYDNTFEVAQWVVISKNIRSNFRTQRASFNIDYMNHGEDKSYKWLVGGDVSYEKLSDVYYIPASSQNVKNVKAVGHLKKNFTFGKNSILVAGNIGYKFNLSSDHAYTGINASSQIYTDMVLRDYDYLRCDYWKFGGELSYTRRGIFKGKTALFASVSGDYYKTINFKDRFNRRGYLNCKLGLAF